MNTNDAVYTSASYASHYRPEKSIYQDDARIFRFTATAEQATLAITPAPLSVTVWLMDTRAAKVQSMRDALIPWEVFEHETMISLVVDGVEVLFW